MFLHVPTRQQTSNEAYSGLVHWPASAVAPAETFQNGPSPFLGDDSIVCHGVTGRREWDRQYGGRDGMVRTNRWYREPRQRGRELTSCLAGNKAGMDHPATVFNPRAPGRNSPFQQASMSPFQPSPSPFQQAKPVTSTTSQPVEHSNEQARLQQCKAFTTNKPGQTLHRQRADGGTGVTWKQR